MVISAALQKRVVDVTVTTATQRTDSMLASPLSGIFAAKGI